MPKAYMFKAEFLDFRGCRMHPSYKSFSPTATVADVQKWAQSEKPLLAKRCVVSFISKQKGLKYGN